VKRLALLFALFLGLLSLCACKKGAPNLCASGTQCATGFSCDAASGACRCDSDAACSVAESCNAAGFCQPRLRCDGSSDCASGSLCDSASGVCIPQGTCKTDVQCKAGQVCHDFACVPGCNKQGDCGAPSDVCRACPLGPDCAVGKSCVPGHCDSQTSCPYGDVCTADPSDPNHDKICTKDARGPFCQPCSRQAGTVSYCPDDSGFGNGNYCLIDTSQTLGQAFYCGVDCTQAGATECPNGYQCRDIRIVTASNCDRTAGLSACASHPSQVSCDPAKNHPGSNGGLVNDDCDAAQPPLTGAVCDPGTRRCVPQCVGTGETGVQAFCSCIEDQDCPQDQCDSIKRACTVSGRPCISGKVPDECQSQFAIRCVKATDARLGDIGYCRIGRNCAPAEGFTCKALRGG